jgi:hypothetical protein
LSVTRPNSRSGPVAKWCVAHVHSACAAHSHAGARPMATRGAARVHGAGAVGTSAVGTGEARRRRQRSGEFRTAGRNGAVETPARGPDSAFNTLERRGTWQPRSNGAARRARRGARRLTGGSHSSAFSKLKITPDENSSK